MATMDRKYVAYDDRIEKLRKREYPMLKDITYLDHGGTTLASKSLMISFSKRMQSTLLANPHSDASKPSSSSSIISETRTNVLRFFNADPKHFDIVFTANATAAIKLVMECFSDHEHGFNYYYHRNAHTSLVGVRELAATSRCFETDEEATRWLSVGYDDLDSDVSNRPTLFAYAAQSNMNGQRLPLDWAHKLRQNQQHRHAYTLLDAAAFVTTGCLDLSDHVTAPDFVALSFYKIFGFPDLGALLVRKASAHVLDKRKYFGGGTTDMATCFEEKPWVARKQETVHARLEDGTIAIRSILALSCAMEAHMNMFGTMVDISNHTGWLTRQLYDRLKNLRHANGALLCQIYQADGSTYGDPISQGATIAMNLRKSDGSWWSPFAVSTVLRNSNIHVRSGSLCNPGGIASALNLSGPFLRQAYDAGLRCNQPNSIDANGAIFGMIRVTFGAMSTRRDIFSLVNLLEKSFLDTTRYIRNDSHLSVVDGSRTSKTASTDEDTKEDRGSFGSIHKRKRDASPWKPLKFVSRCFPTTQRTSR